MLAICLTLIDGMSDKEKFTAVYEAYKNIMYKKALSILDNSSLAEEVVQESFLKIAKNISGISEPVCKRTAAFVIIIVKNTSIDKLRTEHTGLNVPLNEETEFENSGDSFPDINQLSTGKGFEAIVQCIASMDSLYSDVLKLKYIYGYSNGEIAELLDIRQKTVEMRLYRGKKMLKSELEENGYAIR